MELDWNKKQRLAYINPELAIESKERGNALFREGKYGEAIKEYEEAVKRDPNSAPLRNNLAAALLKVTDFNGAKNQVEKSLELDDKYVKAWAKKGDIEFFMKEYHKALDSYKVRATKIDVTLSIFNICFFFLIRLDLHWSRITNCARMAWRRHLPRSS